MPRFAYADVEVTDTTATWIARRLRDAREARGWTQAELASRLHKTQTAISYWEAGKRSPALDDLIEIAFVLGQEVSYFLPSKQTRQPTAAILRAETARLASGELDQAVEDLLSDADRAEFPKAVISVGAVQPAHAANQLLERANVDDAPIPVEHLANLCGVLVFSRPFADALSGFLLQLEGGAVIGVNSGHAPVRRRFSMAHELGHHLLDHSERFHIDLAEGNVPGSDYSSERAANDFAAELLMPRRLLTRFAEAQPATAWLAKRFGVSEIAMGYRLVNLGLR
jgi:Zn-dependent peptidase ImmA (M78 family)/DNA-binding XRE family transcriptional regulator